MAFNFRATDSHNHYNYVFPTSSSPSLNHPFLSDQSMIHELSSGRTVVPVRAAVGFPSSVLLGQPVSNRYQFESEILLHGQLFSPYDIMGSLPVGERYGGGDIGYHHRDIRVFEAAPPPFQRLLPPPEIKEITTMYQPQGLNKEIVVLPSVATVSGTKRKAPSPSSLPAACSSGFGSKKTTEEWRCAVCDISATSEHGLHDHLSGKKHLVKVESLKGNNTCADIGLGVKKQTTEIKSLKCNNTSGDIGFGIIKKKQLLENNNGDIGLGIIKNSVKKQTFDHSKKVKKSDGGKMRKKFKFWCKTCKIGAYEEIVMRDHKKGKTHKKNRRMIMIMKVIAQNRSSGRKVI